MIYFPLLSSCSGHSLSLDHYLKLGQTSAVMNEYHETGSNEYPNILGCPRIDQTNIQIYLDAQDLTKQISKFMRTEDYYMQEILLE